MSHIAVDLKVIEVLAPMVSRAAGISEDRALAGLVRLWHRCWSTKAGTVSLSQLAGVFGGERIAELAEVLCADFLERTTDGFRVRGVDKYLRIDDAKSAAGKVRAASAGRSAGRFTSTPPAGDQHATSSQPALTPSTEHRAPTTKELLPPKRPAPKLEKPSDPRHSPLKKRLGDTFAAVKGFTYPFAPRDFKAISNLLSRAEPDAIDAAWARALREATHPPIACIFELEPKLAHFMGPTRSASSVMPSTSQTSTEITQGF